MQNNLKRSKHLGKYVSSAVLLIVCLLLLFPLIWGVISSFRDANDLRFYPGSFLPTNVKAWTIQNYIAIFSSEEYPVFNWIINSFSHNVYLFSDCVFSGICLCIYGFKIREYPFWIFNCHDDRARHCQYRTPIYEHHSNGIK